MNLNFAVKESGGIPVTESHHLCDETRIIHINGFNHKIALIQAHSP